MLKVLHIVLAVSVFTGSGEGACNGRVGNYDSIYCVCNSEECDSPGPLRQTPSGVVQIFESTREGKRLDQREMSFGEEDNSSGFPRSITIDKSTTFQEIVGFGGAFSDAAAVGIQSMPVQLRTSILSEYYSENGIEYSMGRPVISGCDFSDRPYSYDDTPYEDWDLTEWSLAPEDEYKIEQLIEAQGLAPRPVKYLASSWSPPAWMKTNNQLMGRGQLKEGAGSRYWKTYARYLLKYFDTYKARGVSWWGMTIQNEPGTGFEEWFPWNTCAFSGDMERDFVKMDLGPILDEGGYSPDNFTILNLDHNRNQLWSWADPMFADSEASRYVKGTAVHWYGNSVSTPQYYDEYHAKFPGKFLLATEACNKGDAPDQIALGKWSLGEEYAIDIITDLLHYVAGWVDWNLVLNMQGGPNWVQNFHSAPIIVNPDAREFYKNTQFYAMAHFSKFLPPGSKRIGVAPFTDEGRFKLGAFERPDGAIAIVVVNIEDGSHALTINDPQLGSILINVEPRSFSTYLYYP